MNREDYLEFLDKSEELRRERLDGMEFEERPAGWLADKEYKNADEVIDDLLYLTVEYEHKRMDAAELDQYFYKRQYLQDQLQKFFADEYVLVDKLCKPQKSFNYDPGAEEVITKLANELDCYVVLKKGSMYFVEIGDDTVELGEWPNINKLNEQKLEE